MAFCCRWLSNGKELNFELQYLKDYSLHCPEISHGYVFDDADFDFIIYKTLTFTVSMFLPVYGKWVITYFFFILSMDFSETWWVLGVNRLESDKIFDHHILLPLFIVLPVFEEQVRGHAPILNKHRM